MNNSVNYDGLCMIRNIARIPTVKKLVVVT